MENAPLIDVAGLAALMEARADGRTIVALAGAPGSGKSTIAELLLGELERRVPDSAAVLPMDGFHYDDAVLSARGLLPRKGAPDTFDVGGLRHLLLRLRANAEAEIAVPVFDRALEISRAGARVIGRDTRHVIVEGNYLLLGAPGWEELRALFDLRVFVAADAETLRRRLTERWRSFALSDAAIERKVETNDLPNGRRVVAESGGVHYILRNDA